MDLACLGIALGACGLAFLIYALIHGRNALASPLCSLFLSRRSQPSKVIVTGLSKTFPPSQRALLPKVALGAVDGSHVNVSPESVLEIGSDYRLADPATFLFSGFTVGEVRLLGDFPDYAKLSGVPLPEPARDFDIDSALPRPYRPFRWPYHQTMCM